MKKKYSFIITCILGMSLFFTACEKTEMEMSGTQEDNSDDEYFINPEDTAGIVVPEGYRLVIFPGSKAETRALDPVTSSSKVTHLQYLIYKETANDTYTLYERKTLFNESGTKSWPYKSVPVVLEADAKYKVVFLGNVDKSLFDKQTEVLTGVEDNAAYGDARIHLPNREFSDQSMYYMGKAAFTNTPTADNEASQVVYVPITLQRIVNRVDICKESIGNSYSSYSQDNFCDFLLKTYLMPELKGSGGALHQAITAQVDTLVMGLVYVATRNSPGHNGTTTFSTTADEMYQKYLNGENNYSVLKYRYSQFENGTYSLPDIYNTNLATAGTYFQTYDGSSASFDRYVEFADANNNYEDNAVINLAQYLYDTFHKGIDNAEENSYFKSDGTFYSYWNNFVQKITEYKRYTDTSTKLEDAYTTNLKTALSSTYKNNKSFSAFAKNSTNCYKIAVNQMPSKIDFDMNIPSDGYLNDGNPVELIYQFKSYPSTSYDYYLSIISLGTPTNKLSISSIQGVLGKENWTGNITDTSGWTSSGDNYTILSSSEASITASQTPNVYRKGVYKITPVSLGDKSKKSTVSFPIIHSLESDFISTGDASFIKVEEVYNGSNLTLQTNRVYDLKIGNFYLCKGVNNARVDNFLNTLVKGVTMSMFHRLWMYESDPSQYPAWISLPDISESNLNYTPHWVETDENYVEISGY